MLAQTSVRIFDQARQDNNFRMSSIDIQNIKCVVIGDGGVGKTSLLMTYRFDAFPSEVPNVSDTFGKQVKVDELTYNLNLWDLWILHWHDVHLYRLIFADTDIFLICFSVAEPASFKNVEESWLPLIKNHCPNTPFILVGTKVDLRDDKATLDELAKKQEEMVSKEEGKRMAESLKAAKYLECSAKAQEGMKNLFDEAIRQTSTWQHTSGGKKMKKSENKKCNLF